MVREDRRTNYKGTIFKNQQQNDTYDDIVLWGGYTPSHDRDYARSEAEILSTNRNEAFWKKKLGNYNAELVTDKQYDTINAIANEEDLDHLRGMVNRKKKPAKPKSKRKIIKQRKRCGCK